MRKRVGKETEICNYSISSNWTHFFANLSSKAKIWIWKKTIILNAQDFVIQKILIGLLSATLSHQVILRQLNDTNFPTISWSNTCVIHYFIYNKNYVSIINKTMDNYNKELHSFLSPVSKIDQLYSTSFGALPQQEGQLNLL